MMTKTLGNLKFFKMLPLLITSIFYLHFLSSTFLFADGISKIDINEVEQAIGNPNNNIKIIDFWSTWCSPCQKQVKVLSRLYTKYRPLGISIIGISMDVDKKKVKEFINKQGIKYPIYLGDQNLAYSYNIQALPTTLIYNKDGILIKKEVGFTNADDLKNIIEKSTN